MAEMVHSSGCNQATTIGPSTEKYVAYILDNHAEKKALQLLSTLQNIARKFTTEEFEQAVTTLLEISTSPSNTVLKGILDRKKKSINTPAAKIQQSASTESHGFTRGATYFGRDKK